MNTYLQINWNQLIKSKEKKYIYKKKRNIKLIQKSLNWHNLFSSQCQNYLEIHKILIHITLVLETIS